MAETKRSRGRSCLHTDHRACTCVLWTLTLILMLTRTRICIGKDQGREVGGRRKQFARANGYGTMRRERATFSPFLILSLSLCPPPFSSALKKFLERMSRVHARLCLWTLNRPILPGPRVTGFFGFRVRQWRTSHVLPSNLSLWTFPSIFHPCRDSLYEIDRDLWRCTVNFSLGGVFLPYVSTSNATRMPRTSPK